MPKFGLQILDENMEEVDCFMEDFESQKDLVDWWIENAGSADCPNWHFCVFWKFNWRGDAPEKILKRGQRTAKRYEE